MLLSRIAPLLFGLAAAAAAQPTYTREISRILQSRCTQCHRPNDIAPFALDSYQAAADFREDIVRVITDRIMPPWKPVPGHGEFRGSYALTDEERARIVQWVEAGVPYGEEADLPEATAPTGDWLLGEPDLQLEMQEAYEPPRGRDMYRCFVLPTDFAETRFVSAVDILPGDRRYVHHVILYLDTTGEAEQLDEKDPGPGYTCFGGPGTSVTTGAGAVTALLTNGISLGGWAPGTRPAHLPSGIGMQLPPRARVVMQIHYYARGGTAPDRTRAGIYFSRDPVERRLLYVPILPIDIRGRINMTIPGGAADHEIRAEFPVPPLLDAHVVNVFPHMHLLGKKIRADIVSPRAEERPLIYIDDWDFNWQGPYTYVEPVALPAFSRVRLSCRYDNTEANPRNPSNPVKTVTWGEGTEDEMCLVFLGLTFDRERLR
jgi:mono/diheme cytochrome c family protein